MRLRRTRFADLVSRQLDLFAADESGLLDEAREAENAYNRADREESEELFGDWQRIVDAIGEELLDLRETYAATLDVQAGADYRRAFNRAAAARFRGCTVLLQ